MNADYLADGFRLRFRFQNVLPCGAGGSGAESESKAALKEIMLPRCLLPNSRIALLSAILPRVSCSIYIIYIYIHIYKEIYTHTYIYSM